ncbi:SiaB family protein kinase, partial [Desulfamplus magnetovallimortis]
LSIGDAIKQTLMINEADKKTSKNAFSVFVEQVQNVIRYSAQRGVLEQEKEVSYGILTLGKEGSKTYIDCGNQIDVKDVERIKKSLEKIKTLDRKELKSLYKTILKGETPEGSKGAGVGFIEVALRAKNGFDYDFVEIDTDTYFFSLKAYV